VLKADAIATTEIVCTGDCSSSGPWTKLRLSQGTIYSHTFSISSPGTATNITHQTPLITFAHPITENVAPVALKNLGPARCDSIAVKGSSGCAFSDVAAEYFVYLTGHNEDKVAANVNRGERSKPAHFGWLGHGSPLTRATSSSVAAANRRKACGRKNFKPLTCDEYPFAATFQGAKFFPADNVTAGVPVARTRRKARSGWPCTGRSGCSMMTRTGFSSSRRLMPMPPITARLSVQDGQYWITDMDPAS